LSETDDLHVLAFAAAILALGVAYWLVRDSDQRLAEGTSRYCAASPVAE
jgi:uncharacterized membrane protein (DUF373 family)